jgi:hypothetical protein
VQLSPVVHLPLKGKSARRDTDIASTVAVDHARVLQRCSQWRHAFYEGAHSISGAGAGTGGYGGTGARQRSVRRGFLTHPELDLAVSAGIAPRRVIFHCQGADNRSLGQTIGFGVGRFMVSDIRQVFTVAASARRSQRLPLDDADEQAGALVGLVQADEHLHPRRNALPHQRRRLPHRSGLGRVASFINDRVLPTLALLFQVNPETHRSGCPIWARRLTSRSTKAVPALAALRRRSSCQPACMRLAAGIEHTGRVGCVQRGWLRVPS